MTELILEPDAALTAEIFQRLEAHNEALCPTQAYEANLAVIERDARGHLLAGTYGRMAWGYLYVDCLWVDESRRGSGTGTRLLQKMEQAARERGYQRAWLWTTSFQALDFYRQQGYQVFGELPDRPVGHVTYFLTKQAL